MLVKKTLRMSQKPAENLLLRSGKDRVYLLVGFADFIVINRKIRIFAKHSRPSTKLSNYINLNYL